MPIEILTKLYDFVNANFNIVCPIFVKSKRETDAINF